MVKFISWNVNGLRAIVNKEFEEQFAKLDADVFCLQEIKLQEGQIDLEFPGYTSYWNYAQKKGYSGTAIYSRLTPLSVNYGIDVLEHDQEGRVITLEFDRYYLVNVYTPNAQTELKRLDYRLQWEDDFRSYLLKLNKHKPVILCGDLNVAHQEIDLKNPKTNRKNPGFTDEEREKMTNLLDSGFIDSYRFLNPDKTDVYSWWSYRFNARKNNTGWRIDYFIISKTLELALESAEVLMDETGSDHCPVELILKY